MNNIIMYNLECSSNSSLSIPSRNEANDDDNSDNVIAAAFVTLFVIAVVINILLVVVIAFLVKRLRKASWLFTTHIRI